MEIDPMTKTLSLLVAAIALGLSAGNSLAAVSAEQASALKNQLTPLGAEKALITLSHIEGDQQAIAAHNRLKNSIVIR